MGDTGEAWEVKEYSSSSVEENASKVTWILDKGLNIGKKIVITAVVISSTPFILPPLLVISAIGLALSVPSGILLSSYLCTEKLMSKLLPIKPDYPLMLEGTEEVKEEIKGFESEYRDLEVRREASEKEKGYVEDAGEYVDVGGAEEDSSPKEAKADQPLDRDIVVEDANLESKNVEERESGERVPSEETKAEEIKESESEKKVDVAGEVKQVEDTKGTAPENNDRRDIGVNVVAEKCIVNCTETNKKSAKKTKGNKKKEEGKVPPPTKAEAKDTSEKVPESKQTPATTTGKEAVLSEEMIWEKLDALRAIVGYKASPHRTYIGELKVLYMFTGVDLPASFKDTADLVEVNDRLGFLMSIVGVK